MGLVNTDDHNHSIVSTIFEVHKHLSRLALKVSSQYDTTNICTIWDTNAPLYVEIDFGSILASAALTHCEPSIQPSSN